LEENLDKLNEHIENDFRMLEEREVNGLPESITYMDWMHCSNMIAQKYKHIRQAFKDFKKPKQRREFSF
jgi:4-alpha-glucanotransferase